MRAKTDGLKKHFARCIVFYPALVTVTEAAAPDPAQSHDPVLQPGIVEEVVDSRKLKPGLVIQPIQADHPAGDHPAREAGVLQDDIVKEITHGESTLVAGERASVYVSLGFEGYYDDNVLINRPGREQGDFVWELLPRIVFESSRPEAQRRHFLKSGYDPQWQVFADFGELDSYNHRGFLSYRFLGSNVAARFNHRSAQFSGTPRGADAADFGGLDADLGRRSNGNQYVTRISIDVEASAKSSIEFSGFRRSRNFTLEDFNDSEEWWGEAFFTLEVSPKTQVGIGPRLGTIYINNSPDHAYWQVLARANYRPSPKLAFEIEGGVDFRDYEGASAGAGRDTPVFLTRTAWLPKESTEISLEGFQELRASENGDSIVVTGIRGSLHQRFWRNLHYTLVGGVEDREYKTSRRGVVVTREDDPIFLRNALDYKLGDRALLGLFHEYRKNDSFGGKSFNRSQVGFSVRMDF